MMRTPSFNGWQAVILHEEDANTERLQRRFSLLGIRSSQQWAPLETLDLPDLIVIDADQGFNELLPFAGQLPPRPVLALIGSEAPGRIDWALSQGATAFISKPVVAANIYPALVMAVSIHAERMERQDRLTFLEERLKLRPVVFAAMDKIGSEHRVDAERAYGMLRDCAMRRRLPIEQVAAQVLSGAETLKGVG